MSRETFKAIEAEARRKRYKDPKAVAGKAYYKALMAKFKEAHAKNPVDPSGQIPYWADENPVAKSEKKIERGDVVMYRASFLRSIGAYTGIIPFAEGKVEKVEPSRDGDIAYVLWDYDDMIKPVRASALIQKNRRHLEPNPPLSKSEDIKNRRIVGMLMRLPKVKAAEAGRMGTGEFFYEAEMEDGNVFRHKYATQEEMIKGVEMFVQGIERPGMRRTASGQIDPQTEEEEIRRMAEDTAVVRGMKNPPLPSSAMVELAVARTINREVISGDQPAIGRHGEGLPRAVNLLESASRKLMDSHKGQIDFNNPGPGKITRYRKRTQPLSRHNVVKAIEELIAANIEVGELLARLLHRGIVSDDEYREWKYVQQIAMMLRDDLSLAAGSEMTNPPATEIYRNIIEIRAEKPDGKRYVHKFKRGSNIFGMPDGSILIRSRRGTRLWKNFRVEG